MRIPIITLVALLAAGAAHAGERSHEVYELAFDGRDGPVELRLDSDVLGFSLHEMADGESRSVVLDDGRTVVVSRRAEKVAIEVAGERFEIPTVERGHPVHGHPFDADGLTILSREPLDEATRAQIRSALISAGVDDEVRFHTPPFRHGGPRELIIRKEIDSDNTDGRIVVRREIHADHED